METPSQTVSRLLTALEDLVAQEALLLRADDLPAVLATQHRAGPLIERLTLMSGTVDAAAEARMALLVSRRRESEAWLETQMNRVRSELGETRESQNRVARFAPVYCPPVSKAAKQLSAVG